MNDIIPLQQLADIELPPAPQWQSVFTVTGLITLVVGAIMWRIWLAIKNRRQATTNRVSHRADNPLDKLEEIRQYWKDGQIDARETAYRLAALIRVALGLPQLTANCPDVVTTSRDHWPKTIDILTRARYRPVSDIQLSPATFDRIRYWLDDARTRGIK